MSDNKHYPMTNEILATLVKGLEGKDAQITKLKAALKAAEEKQCASCRHCDSFGLRTALQGDAP